MNVQASETALGLNLIKDVFVQIVNSLLLYYMRHIYKFQIEEDPFSEHAQGIVPIMNEAFLLIKKIADEISGRTR